MARSTAGSGKKYEGQRHRRRHGLDEEYPPTGGGCSVQPDFDTPK